MSQTQLVRPYTLTRIENPEIEVVTLAEMKRHSRLFDDITDEDADVLDLIVEAREWVEDYTGRALVDQTWELVVDPDNLPVMLAPVTPNSQPGELWLRRSPILEVVSIASVSAAGVVTDLDVADYPLRSAASKWPRLLIGSSITDELRVTFRAGFANRSGSPVDGAEVVPKVFKRAIKLIAGHYYEHREPIVTGTIATELQLSIKWLLAGQRCELGVV